MVISTLEIDIAEWLLNNRDYVERIVQSRFNPSYHLFPDSLYDIYIETFSDNVINIIKEIILDTFQTINYEDVSLIINKKWIIMVLGKDILNIPKQEETTNGI